MFAFLCLCVPPIVLFFARALAFGTPRLPLGRVAELICSAAFVNGLAMLILRLLFHRDAAQVLARFSRPGFAVKYFALAMALSVAELLAEKLYRTARSTAISGGGGYSAL